MNRKQRIIVSVTGIFLVLLILVGLTYAYFLTKIKGNDNEKSISVTTANLELVYGDGNALITAEKIEPGNSITAKTFTVTNSGNATINNYAVYLEELVNNLERTSDMVYTLTCTSSVTNSTCNGKTETVFPTQNGILVTNNIVKDEVQTYSLQLTYKEMNVDQSVDMGKEVSAKVQIYNLRDIVDITGTVTGASEGDYVELHSNPKKSQINNNTYTIPGVEPGSHTIYLKDKDGKVLGQKDITINKGETAGVSGTTITTTEDSQIVTINLTKTSSDFTINLDKVEDYMPFEEGTLAYSIINNAKNGTISGKSIYIPNLSSKGMVDNPTTSNDKILSTAIDDYGTTYYFRGNPIDNYVNYAGMCWRIVRIQGDGSIKLILASEKTCSTANLTDSSGYATDADGKIISAYYGYWAGSTIYNPKTKRYYNYESNWYASTHGPYDGDTKLSLTIKGRLNEWLNRKIINEKDIALLKNDVWCIGDQSNGYSYDNTGEVVVTIDQEYDGSDGMSNLVYSADKSFRFTASNKKNYTKTPSYECEITGENGEIDINNIGTITFDEVVYAGGGAMANSNYYLNNNSKTKDWWTISPSILLYSTSTCTNSGINFGKPYDCGSCYAYSFIVQKDGDSSYANRVGRGTLYIRPVVTLLANTQISSGNGTIESPYSIN